MSWWLWLIVGVGVSFLVFVFVVVLAALSRASQSDLIFDFAAPDVQGKRGTLPMTGPWREDEAVRPIASNPAAPLPQQDQA